MEFSPYIRKPFSIEATEITDANIGEVAKLIGTLKEKGGQKFIQLDRRVVPNVSRAFPGWFVTRLGSNFRAYAPRVFEDQFVEFEPQVAFSLDLPEAGVETPVDAR